MPSRPGNDPMRLAWSIWGIAALFYLYEFIQRVAPAVMTAELMRDLEVSAATLGSLSASYYYAYAFCQIPAGICVDRYSLRKVLTLACCITVLGSYLFCSTHHLISALLARSIIGFGSAFAFVGCLKLASRWTQTKDFPLMVGLTNLCGVFGAMIGGTPLAIAVDVFGWQEALLGLTGIGLLLLISLWRVIRDYPTKIKAPIEPSLSIANSFIYVISTPQIWWISLYGCLLVAPVATLPELWSVPFFMEAQSLERPLAAFASSMIFVGIACGGPLFGVLATRFVQYSLLLRGGTLLALCSLMLVIYGPPLPFFFLCFCLWIFGVATSNMLLCFSLVTEHLPRGVWGMAIGFTNMIVMLGGALFQPCIGKLLDHYAQGLNEGLSWFSVSDYRKAFTVLPICLILGLLVQLKLRRGKHACN